MLLKFSTLKPFHPFNSFIDYFEPISVMDIKKGVDILYTTNLEPDCGVQI